MSPKFNRTEDDLDLMIESQTEESRTLDFKRDTYKRTDSGKKEFCADVVSFANADGGEIIIGMDEDQGVATEVIGLPGIDCDKEKNRLQQIADSAIEPRISGLSITSIPLQDAAKDNVIVVRIPRSFAGPHRVKNGGKFHIRRDSGKTEMQIDEIRRAFNSSDSIVNELRAFRESRVRAVHEYSQEDNTDWNGVLPVDLEGGIKLVLHTMPLGSPESISLQGIFQTDSYFQDVIFNGYHNLDGFVLPDGRDRSTYPGYMQIFRDGKVEYVKEISPAPLDVIEPRIYNEDTAFIAPYTVEDFTIERLSAMLQIQSELGVDYPRSMMVTLVGVQGYIFPPSIRINMSREQVPIRRSILSLPEVVLMNEPSELTDDLRPILYALWNAVGYRKSLSYDKDGRWRREKR